LQVLHKILQTYGGTILKNKIIIFLSIVLILPIFNYAIKIQKIKTIPIDQESVIIQRVKNFSVTENENFIIPDKKAGDIKVFNNQGKLVKKWGRKGPGPNEFLRPMYSDYLNPYLMIMDWGKRKLMVFEKKEAFNLIKLYEKFIMALAYDIKFIDKEKFLISGFKEDANRNHYDLYFFYPRVGKFEYILPSHLKYGYSSHKEYEKNYLPKIAPIGISGFCDYFGNNIFFAWEGDLNVVKINRITKMVIKQFGLKTMNYIQPVATPRIVRLYNERSDDLDAEMQKISYVTGIFADEGFVGLTYANFKKEVEGWQTIVQFYNHNGEFLKEAILPGAINTTTYADPSFCYVKENNTLYYLARTMDEEFNDIFKILKFKITL
jgi:6-bladed beta-propeller